MGTINVNLIADNGGGSNVTVQGEGTNTTNLVQGLCKAWCHYTTASSFTEHGSFNVSSLSDEGAGMCKCNFTNVMANDDFAKAIAQGENHGNDQSDSTDFMFMQTVNNSHAAADSNRSSQTAFGDLA